MTEEIEQETAVNTDLVRENTIGYSAAKDDSLTPVVIYSFGFDAEQLLTVYNALRTYLRVSVQQDNEDLETIEQIAAMLIDIKPRAVEASKHLTEKRNARTD